MSRLDPGRGSKPPGSSAYRQTRAIPHQLLDHCRVDFEERLWSQAFSLLESVLVSGTGTPLAAHVADPPYLALAATLAVHPSLTSRTVDAEKLAASAAALRYLDNVCALVGPVNADFNVAFHFEGDSESSRREKRARTRKYDVGISGKHDSDDDLIQDSYAQSESLWRNASDFWSVVGWSFNCSILHPPRWERWKLWLHFMLNAIETDLDIRAASHGEQSQMMLEDSLIALYLKSVGQSRQGKRRVLRAVMADADPKSLAEFREIWANETKSPTRPKTERMTNKRRRLDVESGEFADYLDSGSETETPSQNRGNLPRSRRSSRGNLAGLDDSGDDAEHDAVDHDGLEDSDDEIKYESDTIQVGSVPPSDGTAYVLERVEAFGGMDSIELRQRLLVVIARFCALCPGSFSDEEELYELYTDFIRPLPLPIFRHFACLAQQSFSQKADCQLSKALLRPLLATTAPRLGSGVLNQASFTEHYAPYAANATSFADNAKVSLIIESLLRHLWRTGGLQASARLTQAVESGVVARRLKPSHDGRRKGKSTKDQDEQNAAQMLALSESRMKVVLDMIP